MRNFQNKQQNENTRRPQTRHTGSPPSRASSSFPRSPFAPTSFSRSIYVNVLLKRQPAWKYVKMNSLDTSARTESKSSNFNCNIPSIVRNPFTEQQVPIAPEQGSNASSELEFLHLITPKQNFFSSSQIKDFIADFHPPKSNYTIVPQNTTLQIQKSLDAMVSPQEQNVFKWACEFFESANICN